VKSAEARAAQLEDTLRAVVGACAPPLEALYAVEQEQPWLSPSMQAGIKQAVDALRDSLPVLAEGRELGRDL
jgi:hypothetical protein